MLFCLLMKRVAKLTGAAVSMASGNLPILLEGTVQKLLHAYAEAFAARALHRDGFSWIGVSALALFVIFLIGIAWLYRRKLLERCICCSGFFWNAVRGCGEKFRPMQRWLQLYCCVQTGALSMTG